MTEELKQTLQEFGLTEKEAQVYLLLLSKTLTASEIAQKTNIHRISIYDILERLQEKGIISYVIRGKRKIYEATDPKKLLQNLDEKRDKIKNILPLLIERKNLLEENQEATIFKDKKGIKNIIAEMHSSKTEVVFFASGGRFTEHFPDYSPIWHDRFLIKKIKVRFLLSSSARPDYIPTHMDFRYLPTGFAFPSTTCVWEDKVFIIMWSAQPIAVLIRSKEISDSYRQFFEMLWKISTKTIKYK